MYSCEFLSHFNRRLNTTSVKKDGLVRNPPILLVNKSNELCSISAIIRLMYDRYFFSFVYFFEKTNLIGLCLNRLQAQKVSYHLLLHFLC